VPEEVKQERRERLMALQQHISLEKNQALVGKTLDVLVEGTGDGLSLGRSYRDAPEIDGMVIIEGEVPPGEMVPVRISGAMAYDLSGTVATVPATVIGLSKRIKENYSEITNGPRTARPVCYFGK